MNGLARLFSDGSVRGGAWISKEWCSDCKERPPQEQMKQEMDLVTGIVRFVIFSLVQRSSVMIVVPFVLERNGLCLFIRSLGTPYTVVRLRIEMDRRIFLSRLRVVLNRLHHRAIL